MVKYKALEYKDCQLFNIEQNRLTSEGWRVLDSQIVPKGTNGYVLIVIWTIEIKERIGDYQTF